MSRSPPKAPQFTIIYAGARPEIGYIGRRLCFHMNWSPKCLEMQLLRPLRMAKPHGFQVLKPPLKRNRLEGSRARGGLWTHHSRAQTQEEVMATAERANLRVCWRFGGNGAKYVEEASKARPQSVPCGFPAVASSFVPLRPAFGAPLERNPLVRDGLKLTKSIEKPCRWARSRSAIRLGP